MTHNYSLYVLQWFVPRPKMSHWYCSKSTVSLFFLGQSNLRHTLFIFLAVDVGGINWKVRNKTKVLKHSQTAHWCIFPQLWDYSFWSETSRICQRLHENTWIVGQEFMMVRHHSCQINYKILIEIVFRQDLLNNFYTIIRYVIPSDVKRFWVANAQTELHEMVVTETINDYAMKSLMTIY